LHNAEVINALLQIFSNAQYKINICGNSKFLTKVLSFSTVDKVRLDACKRKDLRQRYVFEITKENIRYCKTLMKGAELRHLDKNEANFVTNEIECLGFSDAIGFIEHSNSSVGVYSARSFFELLRNEHLQYEKLKQVDEMKSEFINVAAHELRTPTQPILSLSQVLQSGLNDTIIAILSINPNTWVACFYHTCRLQYPLYLSHSYTT
jgi:hypothetical protein